MRGSFLGRRLFQTSLLFLAIGSLGIFLGTRTRSATIQPSAPYEPKSASPAVAQGSGSASEPRVTGVASGLSSPAIPQTGAGRSSVEFFTYVIQPKDTLRDLCVSMLGRYDGNVLSEIRELNPDLKDPNHLDAGQEIRLPMSVAKY
jgi:hypothetical protein